MNQVPVRKCGVDMTTLEKIEKLSIWMMERRALSSLVINAPEDDEDFWRVYPSGQPAIGRGKSLPEAISAAYESVFSPVVNRHA